MKKIEGETLTKLKTVINWLKVKLVHERKHFDLKPKEKTKAKSSDASHHQDSSENEENPSIIHN